MQSPLTDSNRRPPLYEEGPRVKRWLLRPPVKASALGGRGELGSSLYRLLVGGQGRLEFAPVAHLLKDRQAARGSVAPAGAKGWLRVSMCQIASAKRRARSTCATLAPRCLPMRFRVRVALAVGRMRAGVGRGLHQRPAEIAWSLLGERAAQVALTGLVDARAEAGVAGEFARAGEAVDVAELGGDRVGEHPADPRARCRATARSGGRRRADAAHARSR